MMCHRRRQTASCRGLTTALSIYGVTALSLWHPINAAVIIEQFIEGSSFNKVVSIVNSGTSAVVRSHQE